MQTNAISILFFVWTVFFLAACGDSTSSKAGIQNPNKSLEMPTISSTEEVLISGSAVLIEGKGLYTCPDGNFYVLDAGFVEKFNAAKTSYFTDYPAEGSIFQIGVEGKAIGAALVVDKITGLSDLNRFNCCVPFDFWAGGTEPFWDFYVSEKMNIAECRDLGVSVFTKPYTAPEKLEDGSLVYRFGEKGAPDFLEFFIKKGRCSDGMSDIGFSYEATVQTAKTKLKGCAAVFGEKLQNE